MLLGFSVPAPSKTAVVLFAKASCFQRRASVKNAAFDIDKVLTCINGYEKISLLKKEEKELLYVLIKFPKDFYTISRDYYYKRKRWDYEVYLNRFKTKLNNEEFRYEFLKVYKNKFLIES